MPSDVIDICRYPILDSYYQFSDTGGVLKKMGGLLGKSGLLLPVEFSSREFPDFAAAQAYAFELAKAAIHQLTKNGDPVGARKIEIRDSKGSVLTSVRLRDLLT